MAQRRSGSPYGTHVYYTENNSVRAIDLESLKEREVCWFEAPVEINDALTISADGRQLISAAHMEPIRGTMGYNVGHGVTRDGRKGSTTPQFLCKMSADWFARRDGVFQTTRFHPHPRFLEDGNGVLFNSGGRDLLGGTLTSRMPSGI